MNHEVYQVITDRIIGLLEKGVVPWQKPWQGGEQMPRNLVSGHEYRGVNVFLLHAVNYTSPYWLTFNQARELGGHVKKGERSCPVVPGLSSGRWTIRLLTFNHGWRVSKRTRG
jgi:antirestriction protein ArdC